jgi:hypothetical protein
LSCVPRQWFKTYYNEVHWYEFKDKVGLPVLRTYEELALEDTSFWNNHELKAIILKDVE